MPTRNLGSVDFEDDGSLLKIEIPGLFALDFVLSSIPAEEWVLVLGRGLGLHRAGGNLTNGEGRHLNLNVFYSVKDEYFKFTLLAKEAILPLPFPSSDYNKLFLQICMISFCFISISQQHVVCTIL